MGTRAQFFVGDPSDVNAREWLGCVAWDGYPDGDIGEAFDDVTTEDEFRQAVQSIAARRRDFCAPAKHGFPFPWTDDLYLTDYTYAFFDECVLATHFHRGWRSIVQHNEDEAYREDHIDELSHSVPVPTGTWDRSAPDSTLTVTVPA